MWMLASSPEIFNVSPESSIDFFCAICGSSLAAAPEHEGSLIECPMCERSVPVPGAVSVAGTESGCLPVFRPEILSVEITFVCPGCERALVADARQEGDAFRCPKCGSEGRVPDWSGARPRVENSARPVAAVVLSAEEIGILSGDPTAQSTLSG